MVATRGSTGNSAPRKADPLYDAPAPSTRVTKAKPKAKASAPKSPGRGRPAGSTKNKSAVTAAKEKTKAAAAKVKKEAVKAEKKVETKANTGKPRAKKDKVATGRVEKKPAAKKGKTVNKREPGIMDKIEGAAEKLVGAVQGNPAKKAAGTRKMRGTDGKGAKRASKGSA